MTDPREDIGPDDQPILYSSDRPVMDLAESNKRRQDIIDAAKAVVVAVIALVPLVFTDLITAQQMGGILLLVGAIFVGLQVIYGRKTLEEAEIVESLVTPTNNPKDDSGNILSPGVLGSDDPETLPVPDPEMF